MLMKVAEFRADFPDDRIEENGEIVRTPGLNVATELSEMLRKAGYAVEPPEPHSYYGWSFIVRADDRRIWIMIQGGNDWILLSEDESTLMSWIWPSRGKTHENVMNSLEAGLARDPRFGPRTWYRDRKVYGKAMSARYVARNKS